MKDTGAETIFSVNREQDIITCMEHGNERENIVWSE